MIAPKRHRTCLRTTTVGMIVAAAVAACPAGARASSLLYVQEGNVFLSEPDGSGAYQVTLDGSVADPYQWPTAADDGTIVALRGSGSEARFYRMQQNGTLLNPPFGSAAPGTAPLAPVISPDGRLIVYWFVTVVSCPFCPVGTSAATLYSYADRYTSPHELGVELSLHAPAWASNTRTFGVFASTARYDAQIPGANNNEEWFSHTALPSEGSFLEIESASAVGRLAMVRGVGDARTLYFLDAPGGATQTPPPLPTLPCVGGGPTRFEDLSFSHDGRMLAVGIPEGILLLQLPASLEGNCGLITQQLVIPGAVQPDLGPAPIAPAPRGGPGGSVTTTTVITPGAPTTTTVPGCTTAAECLAQLRSGPICTQGGSAELQSVVDKKLSVVARKIAKASTARRQSKIAALVQQARAALQAIEAKADRFLRRKRAPISADCRESIRRALTPVRGSLATIPSSPAT